MNRTDRIFLWIVIIVGLMVRLLWMHDYVKTAAFPFRPDGDSQAFFWKAKDIAWGDFSQKDLNLSWPFYIYFLGLLAKLFSGQLVIVLFVQYLLGIVNAVLIYWIGSRLFGKTAGLIAGLLCSFYPYFLFFESMLMYTSLSVVLISWLFLGMLDLQESPTLKRFFLTGMLFGVTVLTQANVLFFGFPAIAWVLYQGKWIFAKTIRYAALFIAGFLLIVSLQFARDSIAHRTLTVGPQVLGINFFLGNNPRAKGFFFCPEDFAATQKGICRDARAIARGVSGRDLSDTEVSRYWGREALKFIQQQPLLYGGLIWQKIKAIFASEELVVEHEWRYVPGGVRISRFLPQGLRWILPFAVLGMVLSFRMFRRTFLLYLILAAFIFVMLLFFVMAKHRLALIPFLSLFAGHGVAMLLEWIRNKRYAAFALASGLLGCVFFTTGYSLASVSPSRPVDAHLGWVREGLIQVDAAISQKKYEEAEAALEELKRLAPYDRFVVFNEGVIKFSVGDMVAAEKKFKEATHLFPYYVDAFYNLGLVYNKEGRYQEAEAMLAKAASLDPDDIGVIFEWACALKSLGRIEEARIKFSQALEGINRWRQLDIARIKTELKSLSLESL